MRMKAIGLLAAMMLLVGQVGTAGAVTVKPSGKYAFTSFNNCESHFEFQFGLYRTFDKNNPDAVAGGNAVRIISVEDNGHFGSGVGHLTFTPISATAGTVVVSLLDIGGGALRISDVVGAQHHDFGVDVTTDPQKFTGNYTAAAKTFTIAGMTYMVAYGALDTAGTPVSIHLVRNYVSGNNHNCVEAITATR
jgi:hypothetical protein